MTLKVSDKTFPVRLQVNPKTLSKATGNVTLILEGGQVLEDGTSERFPVEVKADNCTSSKIACSMPSAITRYQAL